MLFRIKKVLNYLMGKVIDYRILNFFKIAWWFFHYGFQPVFDSPFRFATSGGAGRDGLFYIEDDNWYLISAEILVGVGGIKLYRSLVVSYTKGCPNAYDMKSAMACLSNQGLLVEVEEREQWRIITNVCALYDLLGTPYAVVP